MKRITILLVFVCFAKINVAQLYQPFPTDSAVWRQLSQQWDFPWMDQQDYSYFLNGDTLISGNIYHKVYKTILESHYQSTGGPWAIYAGPYMTDTNQYVGGIREDGFKHIYFLSDTAISSFEILLYDFNLSVGDTLAYSYNNSSYFLGSNFVSAIDSVMVGTMFHKQFHVSSTAGYPDYVSIIEGIGSTFGLLEMLIDPFEWSDNLVCYVDSGATVYSNGWIASCVLPSPVGLYEYSDETPISIFPNPTKGIINLKTAFSEKTQIEIFDVLGKRVYKSEQAPFEFTIDLSEQPKGVYFLKANSGNKISKTQKIVLQ